MSFNFAVILFWLMVATGAVWVLDALVLKPRRRIAAEGAVRQSDEQSNAQLQVNDGTGVEEGKHLG